MQPAPPRATLAYPSVCPRLVGQALLPARGFQPAWAGLPYRQSLVSHSTCHGCPYAVYNCTYVLVEWDPGKARLNLQKHGVSFADAVGSLEDEGAITIRDSFLEEEERWITMGLDALGRILVVIYTLRNDNVRIISARKATPRERRRYEEANEARI